MNTGIFARVTSALRPRRQDDGAVHFHRGPQGLPAVCDDPRCDRPHLDVA